MQNTAVLRHPACPPRAFGAAPRRALVGAPWVCAALQAPAAFKQPFLLEIARIPKVPRCEITASEHVRLGSFPRCSLENAEFFLHPLKHQAIDSRHFAFSQPPPPLMLEIPRHRLTPGHLVPMLL